MPDSTPPPPPFAPASPRTNAAKQKEDRQARGLERNGSVLLRAFDEGIIETLGAFIVDDAYWLRIPGVDPPPNFPGTPVTFSFPEDIFKTEKLPFILVRRDAIDSAMERWHPGTVTYATPVKGDLARSTTVGNPPAPSARTVTGPGTIEQQEQAHPYDITYTLSCIAHYRGGISVRGAVNTLFQYVLKYYQAYCTVGVRDSLGSLRGYSGFQTGTSVLDEIPEITDRVLGFGVTVRVEAELDLNDPYFVKTVSRPLTLRLHRQ